MQLVQVGDIGKFFFSEIAPVNEFWERHLISSLNMRPMLLFIVPFKRLSERCNLFMDENPPRSSIGLVK